MPYGYSNAMATRIREKSDADPGNALYRLCRLCVDNNVMLSTMAARLGVTKQAIYGWLNESYQPTPDVMKKIETQIKRLEARYNKA